MGAKASGPLLHLPSVPDRLRRRNRRGIIASTTHGPLRKGSEDFVTGKLQQTAPLRVVPFIKLRAVGHLPRSSQCKATLPSGMICGANHTDLLEHAGLDWDFSGKPIVMISHSWIRASEGMPDDTANRKHTIVVAGVEELCKHHKIAEDEVYVFLDWISIPQESLNDGTEDFYNYVTSLPAFVAQMAFVLVPLDSSLLMTDKFRLDSDGNQVQMNWEHYSARGWCRAEMLAGRAMAACGTGVRVYRCDASWQGSVRLIEVPPYTGASKSLLPTGNDALYSCCQADHYDPINKRRFPCDRDSVKYMEVVLRDTVNRHQRQGRKKLFARYPLDDVGGLPALEASAFLEYHKIPMVSDGFVHKYTDDMLKDKVVFYFIDQAWQGDEDAWRSFKHRWMSAALKKLIVREGLELNDCLVFLTASCGQYSELNLTAAQVLVRVTYVVVFNLGADGSHAALERGLIRLELFVARLVAAAGLYTAIYESRLRDKESLAEMTLDHLDVGDISGFSKVEDYEATDDPLCPWTGQVREESIRMDIKEKASDILAFAATFGKKDVSALRESLIARLQDDRASWMFARSHATTNFSENPAVGITEEARNVVCRRSRASTNETNLSLGTMEGITVSAGNGYSWKDSLAFTANLPDVIGRGKEFKIDL